MTLPKYESGWLSLPFISLLSTCELVMVAALTWFHQSENSTYVPTKPSLFTVFVPVAAIRIHHKLSDLNQQKFIIWLFWKLDTQNQDVTRICPFQGYRKDSFLASSSFWWFLEVLGISWLVDPSLHYLPPSSHGLPSMCVCVPVPKGPSPSLMKTLVIGLRMHPTPV